MAELTWLRYFCRLSNWSSRFGDNHMGEKKALVTATGFEPVTKGL